MSGAAGTLVIRADADADIGTGHVMRCVALAHAWRANGGKARFVGNIGAGWLRERVAQVGELVELAREKCADAAALIKRADKSAWVIVDGYRFDGEYQRQVKGAGLRLAVFDDYRHADYYAADIVVNQNLGAESLHYPREAYTRLLLGPKYAVLRPEYEPWAGWRREFPARAARLLVTLGGSDAEGYTGKVLQALEGAGAHVGMETVVVAGPLNPHRAALEAQAARMDGRARLLSNVDDFPALLAWADLTVIAGGTTAWEAAFMGVPAIVLVLADNQERIAAALDAERVAQSLGWARDADALRIADAVSTLADDRARREGMSRRGRRLVDGRGAARVVEAMTRERQ